jgi:hypothetical protein
MHRSTERLLTTHAGSFSLPPGEGQGEGKGERKMAHSEISRPGRPTV